MAMMAKEIKDWLATISDDAEVAINDDGMALVVRGEQAYIEIGGVPLSDGSDESDLDYEEGWENHV